jgi:hypothetical protein
MTTVPETTHGNGADPVTPTESVLPRHASATQIFKILEDRYGVPRDVIDQLGEVIARSFADIVDNAMDQKKWPQSYFILRRLTNPGWLR